MYGLGRMGITHLSHTQGYMLSKGLNCKFDIIDPSLKTMRFRPIRKNINIIGRSSIHDITDYDYAFITSPPNRHNENLREAIKVSKKIFIEKPAVIAVETKQQITENFPDRKIYVGYVLRKNLCVQKLKDLCNQLDDYEIHIDLQSNIGLNEVSGWRSKLSSGGGCFNEFGSHVINLFQYLSVKTIGAVNPIVMEDSRFDIDTGQGRLTGNWCSDVRKSMYHVRIVSKDTTYYSDLQYIESENGYYFNPRQLTSVLPYYMRGLDFALQSKDFLEGSIDENDFYDALTTDTLMAKVLG
ncbi:Gfo/Idh/MocA family oxidoreductase [Octadecabacter sp.]|nr:Gfo/Idh/MocA family oxidoreductase [Octadecabacter sp.]